MTILVAILRALGLPLVIVIGFIAYYEGIPFLKDIPFADRIPVVRELLTGRVQSERAKAADTARSGYVLLSEKIAAEAEAAKLKKDADATAKVLDYYRKELVRTYTQQAQDDQERDKERADYVAQIKKSNEFDALGDARRKWLLRKRKTSGSVGN